MLVRILTWILGERVVMDTLMRKKDGELKFSKTAFTMFSSFAIATFYAIYSLFAHGFRYEVFIIYLIVAVTGSIPDRFGKKLQPKNDGQ